MAESTNKRKRNRGEAVRRTRPRRGGRKPKARVVAKRRKASKRRMVKQIKSVVKREMQCSENVGVYTKLYTGEIEPTVIAGRDNYCFAFTRNNNNIAPYTVFNCLFKPFSRKKILDAVSTLYNGKARSLDVDAAGNFNLEGVKIETLYCSYEMMVSNYTQFPYEVELWSIENKENNDRLPLDAISKMELADEWVGSDPKYELVAGNQYSVDKCFDLSMIKGLASKFKLKREKRGMLYPGGTLKHFVKQGAKCYDMTKDLFVTNDGVAVLPSHSKGEISYFLKYSPVLHMYSSTTNYVATNSSNTGGVSYGFLVQIKEVFKFFEPAETSDTQHGDKRGQYLDIPATADGAGPNVSRFINTGPSYTDITNPVT